MRSGCGAEAPRRLKPAPQLCHMYLCDDLMTQDAALEVPTPSTA